MNSLVFNEEGRNVQFLEMTENDHAYDVTVRASANLTLMLLIHDLHQVEAQVHVHLTAPESSVRIIGCVIAGGEEKVTLRTLQHHAARQTTSNLLIRAVLSGKADFTYAGGIRVDKDAQKTDAYQRNENLLLSHESHATSSPGLEILANDVRCTHGATIGRVSEDQLWYLNSRGVSIARGKELIVQGFLLSALESIEHDNVHGVVKQRIQQALM